MALIVGAGIGGLAAAIALKRAGWNVRVFERAAKPRELGFALMLAPNAMHALGAPGLAETARQGGFVMTSGEWRRPDGTVLRRLDTQSMRALVDEDTVCILRPVLHGMLLEAIGSDAVELGASHFHEPFRGIVRATPPHEIRLDDLYELNPLDTWGAGPVTLLGDAAHPMLPHAGQGAAQALEDAAALGAVLREASNPAAIEVALRRYEDVRATRTRKVVDLASRNARIGSIRSGPVCWLRDQVIRYIPESVILKSLVALGRAPEITSVPTP